MQNRQPLGDSCRPDHL